MDKRLQELTELQAYTDNIEKEVTSLLQNLHWDKKKITEKPAMVVCKHNANHRIPVKDREMHETQCYLTKLGYSKQDVLLPDPVDRSASTLVKFSKQEIANIIQSASSNNPSFKRGIGCPGPEPLTVARLQLAYSADERRAIHDAVVNAAPFCHDLTDLELLSSSHDEAKTTQKKSRLEILAELRNMKRRRTKYRVAPKTRNYSDVLRDVIKTQMESYGEAITAINTEHEPVADVSRNRSNEDSDNILHNVVVKQERLSPDKHTYSRYTREYPVERRRERSREMRYDETRRSDQDRRRSDRGKKRIESHGERGYYESRSKHRSRKHERSHRDDDSIDYDSDRRIHSESRYSYRKNHSKDKYSSKDKYTSDNSNDTYKTEVIIKQERASPTEYKSEYTSDSQDMPAEHRNSETNRKKHSWGGRGEKHYDERYILEKLVKQERESPDKYDPTRKGEGSRKRCRSRSRERRHKHRNRSDYERNSLKRK